MRWRTTPQQWGWLTILIHWMTALTVFGLFGLGLWMVELDYYSPWYRKGPDLHKSIGILLFTLTVARLELRRIEGRAEALASHSPREQKLAHLVHGLFYLLLIAVMMAGYFISTADGRAIEVFGLFSIPATLHGIDKQEDIAGLIHLWLAISLISLVVLHAGAAIKHHFFDRDRTLKRMFGSDN
ncbi:MAG: cytochrome b [Gammaproteobacteria bacterium]|nr:cytochrome b [Gammaproteobacteria bacterium]